MSQKMYFIMDGRLALMVHYTVSNSQVCRCLWSEKINRTWIIYTIDKMALITLVVQRDVTLPAPMLIKQICRRVFETLTLNYRYQFSFLQQRKIWYNYTSKWQFFVVKLNYLLTLEKKIKCYKFLKDLCFSIESIGTWI